MPECRRAEHACHGNVVAKIEGAHDSDPDQHDEAAAQNARVLVLNFQLRHTAPAKPVRKYVKGTCHSSAFAYAAWGCGALPWPSMTAGGAMGNGRIAFGRK